VEVVMKRVVPVPRVEANLDIVVTASAARENALHLSAEVAFDFEDQPADAPVAVMSLVGQDLLGVRVHAAQGFSASNRTENRNAGEESPFRDYQPCWVLRWPRTPRVMDFAKNDEEFLSFAGI